MLNRLFNQATRRDWLRWLPTVFAFPLSGVLARALTGPADHLAATLAGGVVVGAVIGAAQALALRGRVPFLPWIGVSAAAAGAGLAAGAGVVNYGFSAADLALQGVIAGAALGTAQWLVLRGLLAGAWRWAPLTAAAWTIGWSVTHAAGIDVERHHHVFGMSGALCATVLTGLLAVTIAHHVPARPSRATEGATA